MISISKKKKNRICGIYIWIRRSEIWWYVAEKKKKNKDIDVYLKEINRYLDTQNKGIYHVNNPPEKVDLWDDL